MTTEPADPSETETKPAATAADVKHAQMRQPPSMSSGTRALVTILLAGVVGMIVLVAVHLSKDGRIQPGAASAHADCNKGTQDCLPDVNYTDINGVAYTPASLKGKVVLVNFWATWCHPCQAEIPDLSKAYDKYKDKGLVILGVMTDDADSQKLLNFQSDHEMTYPVVRQNSDLMVSYNYPDAIPTTFLYDRHGKQVFTRSGALHSAELEPMLDKLLAQTL
jgi:thiol-disulfide isomerase/thioredoxin